MMTIPEIIKALNHPPPGTFPAEALSEAVAQREVITPELLRCLEGAAADPSAAAERQDEMLPFFAVYLLAQFRETRAYAPLVRIVSAPGEIPYQLFEDIITDGLDRILASVYDGNSAPLRYLVENESVDQFVRSAAIDTLLVLLDSGQMPRKTVVEYFRELLQGKMERFPSFAWDALAGAVSKLPAPELLPELRQANEAGLLDSDVADFVELEQEVLAPEADRRERRPLITDVLAELEGWACFQPLGVWDRFPSETPGFEEEFLPPPPYVPPQPYVRGPKIGRNDPCPCGSGKKYKKCCG